MKHCITHKMLVWALAVAAMVVSAGKIVAQEADQSAIDFDETISVNTRLARVGISVPKAGTEFKTPQLRWELSHNSRVRTELTVDAPDAANPLSLVVLVDVDEDGRDRGKYVRISDQLDSIASRLHLKELPRVVVASSASTRFPFSWPKKWQTTYTPSTGEAFNCALDLLERSPGTRRALLILTNRVAQLPQGFIDQADARLANSAAFIYLMAVRPPAHHKYGSAARVIARTNLNTREVAAINPDDDYAAVQFRYFAKLANAYYVISYSLTDQEAVPGLAQAAEIKAVSVESGQVLLTQKRFFRLK